MKKVIFALAILLLIPSAASAYEERDLPRESAPASDSTVSVGPATAFEGYANSRDVTMIGGVMAAVYNFCKEQRDTFCSTEQGILVVTGAETGRVPNMIKDLDTALETQRKLTVKLSDTKIIAGVKEILGVNLIN